MKSRIQIGITARNEEVTIGETLSSLLTAIHRAENETPFLFDPVVILDDCADRTGEIARGLGVRTLASTGRIVEAQRHLAGAKPFVVFCDADIFIEQPALVALCRTMLDNAALQVAYAAKTPLPPRSRSLLAEALYCYNRVNGFQHERRYFNGRFFAIRDWQVPTLAELQPRLARLPVNRFYDFHAGMRIDDIYLSRDILRRYGPDAIREVPAARIHFRPPESFGGMYQTYRRMRLEIERLNILFPETKPAHQQRGYDWTAVRRAPARDRVLWRVFRLALGICMARYAAERFYYQHFATDFCPAWPPILESKVQS
jgi:glycosyltransferase involved in cell wall biosynthesis